MIINDNEIYTEQEKQILSCPKNCKNKDKKCHICYMYSEYLDDTRD